ncbi:MAG: MFS transporter, partial [Comamonas sp.]
FPPAALALVAETLPPARRPLGISLMSFAFLAAAPAAQLLAAQFAGLGLHVIMLALAAGYALLAVGLYRLLPTGMARGKEGAIAANPVPMWRQTQLMGAWLAACTVLFAFVSLHAGAQITGFSESQLQTLRLAGLPPLLICLVAARLVSRIGPVRTARAGLVLSAIALMVGLRDGFWWVVAASVLLSAGIALAVPGLIGTVASRATADFRARAMSLYTFFLFVGASIAPPVAQALAPHGWGALLWAPIAALLAAAAVVNGWSSRWPSVPQPSEHRIS